jgi:hypothetical protein
MMRGISFGDVPVAAFNATPIQAQHAEIRGRLARLGVAVSERQVKAIAYLERNGKRFCVEFGYDNAVRIATALRQANAARVRNGPVV